MPTYSSENSNKAKEELELIISDLQSNMEDYKSIDPESPQILNELQQKVKERDAFSSKEEIEAISGIKKQLIELRTLERQKLSKDKKKKKKEEYLKELKRRIRQKRARRRIAAGNEQNKQKTENTGTIQQESSNKETEQKNDKNNNFSLVNIFNTPFDKKSNNKDKNTVVNREEAPLTDKDLAKTQVVSTKLKESTIRMQQIKAKEKAQAIKQDTPVQRPQRKFNGPR